MPKCLGCGAYYDKSARSCPYCGRTAPEPEIIPGLRLSDPMHYEEGELWLRVTTEEQETYTVTGWFGTFAQKAYIQLGYFDLMAKHPAKGKYVALTSGRFRGLQDTPVGYMLGIQMSSTVECWKQVYNAIESGAPILDDPQSSYIASVIRERMTSWRSFCASLDSGGWLGITDDAVKRSYPWEGPREIELHFVRGQFRSIDVSQWYDKYRNSEPNRVFNIPLRNVYKYRRPVR